MVVWMSYAEPSELRRQFRRCHNREPCNIPVVGIDLTALRCIDGALTTELRRRCCW